MQEFSYIRYSVGQFVTKADYACVRGSPMVPLVGNSFIICTNLITNGTIGKEGGANGKNGNAISTNGTDVTNKWYHWENPEHTLGKKEENLTVLGHLLKPV